MWKWWRVGELVALVAYVVYVIVTGKGPRRLFLTSAGAFAGTLVIFAVLVGAVVLIFR